MLEKKIGCQTVGRDPGGSRLACEAPARRCAAQPRQADRRGGGCLHEAWRRHLAGGHCAAGGRRDRNALPALPHPRASGRGGLSARGRAALRRRRRAGAQARTRRGAGGMDAALRRLHRHQARHGEQPAHPADHQF